MKRLICILCAAGLLLSLCGCGNIPKNTVNSAGDLASANIGVLSGSQAEVMCGSITAGAVTGYPDGEKMMQALMAGITDCVVADAYAANALHKEFKRTKILDEGAVSAPFVAAVAVENSALLQNLNMALAALLEEGTVDDIVDAFVRGEPWESPVLDDSKTITLAAAGCRPFAYKDGGQITGIDVEIAKAMCSVLGIGLEISLTTADKLVTAVQTGQADFAMGQLTESSPMTDRVNLTDVYYTCQQVILVRK